MIKKNIILLILTFFMHGCVERGQSVHPNVMRHSNNTLQIENTQPVHILQIAAEDKKIDPIKNTISGTLILIIGLMIIL